MSTIRFMIATAAAVRTTTPSTRRQVLADGARVIASQPSPWMLNTVSVMIAPPTSSATSRPKMVTIGRQARPEAVLEDDLPLGEPLGARGPDVVLAERLEQVVARQARVDRHVEEREHGPRQDHVAEPVPDPLVDRRVARAVGEAELLPDDVEGHQAEPEDGGRDPEEGKAHRPPVDEGSSLDGRDHPDRHAADEPDRGRSEDQEERPRRALDDLAAHRDEVAVRVAEAGPAVRVALGEVADEVAELDVPGWSRWSRCLTCASESGVGDLPAKRSAGSPFGSR